MKTKTILCATITIVISALTLLSSCFHQHSGINKVNPAFGKYITGFTSGMVSRKSTIRIELSQDILNANAGEKANQTPDSTLLEGIFSFDPEIKGKAVWLNSRTIEFIPAGLLASNQLYSVEFKLNKVMKVPHEFRTFPLQISTYPQNLFVTVDGLSSYDRFDTEWQKLTGKIMTSDYADTAAINKIISVSQEGRKLHVHWSESYVNNEFHFYVDSIARKEKEGMVSVSWNGEEIDAVQNGKQEIIIPPLGNFSVSSAKVIDKGDQYVELRFSDPILYNQNLKGIVTILGVENLTYAIEGNVVKVFLPNRIEGSKTIEVSTGIKNFKAYKMIQPYSGSLTFEEPKPLVRIKGNGCILPNSNGLIFPFEAISLKAVDVRIIKIYENNIHQFLQTNNLDGEDDLTRVGKVIIEKKVKLDDDKMINLKQWNTHVLDLGKLITPDPGAIYRVSIKFNRKYSTCNCAGAEKEEASGSTDNKEEDKNWNEKNWGGQEGEDNQFEDGYQHWYSYENSYSACSNDYYNGKSISRNILASDIGLIYKMDDNKMSHAIVNNMITSKPLPKATIEYYDYVRQLIATGVTDSLGMLDIPLKRKPFLLIAKFGRQRGYLKLLDGNANSLSKFDIEGEVVQKGVKGFLYGERGVWRPGDSLFLTFMLEDKEKKLPLNHPVKFELKDPNGQIIYQTTKTKNVNGMYSFRTVTGSNAPTGEYTAVANLGNRVFTQNLKIETVKPNRLKIVMDFSTEKEDSIAKLQVKWLHGAIAKNLHALVNVTVNQSKTTFDKYKAYEFDSPIRSFSANAESVYDGKLDDKGEADIFTGLSVGENAPGMLRATYITKVFEEGGDFSIDRYSVPYSPYKTYVGLHIPEIKNQDNTLETGKEYLFDVATLNASGNPVNANRLQVKIYKIQWRWWYEKGEENMANYISRSSTIVMKDTLINTKEGKGAFRFRINYPEYGRYLITVTDLEGKHQTGKAVYIDWPYWSRANRSTNENASMLNFACDKEKYLCGEKIKLSFPSSADGMALVSIETGTKVVKKFWVGTKKGETKYEFPATGDMSPNAYIHVTLLQPHANTKNDLPIRMYGVVPVLVDDPATHLHPEIAMPDVIRPESRVSIQVKEQQGKKMSYTLAMVDEGLLDLTRFKLPEAWNTFYAREALGVKTWDMYDAVIGAYAGKLEKLLSIGGDGNADASKGAKANRFKPMVKFFGPFTLESGKEQTHVIDIPNYVGSVRVMVVAENEGAYGSSEKTVGIRKPLMVLATLPRVLGPSESLSLPVDVFAMEKQVKEVKVEVEVNGMLSLTDTRQQTISFKQTGDEVINFNLKVAEKTGIAKVKITATSGKEKAVQEIELDVRTPNPKVVDGQEMAIEPGKSWDADVNFRGIAGTNKATLEFSSIPSLGLEKRMDYLIQYPHGCIEQTTSSVFPQLYVSNLTELKEAQKNQIAQNIKAGLKRLQLFQTGNGGFSYWPGEAVESDWGSNYAGHFMIEAERQGYSLPDNMKNRWVKYQQQQARNWVANNGVYTHPHGNETNEVIQAYRLFVLALCNKAELGAMNRLREERTLSVTAKWRLAGAYKLIGQNEVAKSMIEGISTIVKPYQELSYSYGSAIRDKAMILEILSLMKEKARGLDLAKEVAKSLDSEVWMNTQETSYCLLAMCEFTGAKDSKGEMSFDFSLNKAAPTSITCKKTIYQAKYGETDISKKAKLTMHNKGSSTLFAKVIVQGVPLTGDQTYAAKDLSLEVHYKDMKGKELQPDKMQQGTDFIAEVTITNPGTKGFLKEMTLNQIFPSGWEIHNTRMDETGTSVSAARYQDIRDDRVYSYYELPANTSKKFTIQLNATYLGRFYLPTVYSEAMYDNMINARVPGRWVEVVRDLEGVAQK